MLVPVLLSSPPSLLHPAPYHHVAVASGTRQVRVAGQIAAHGDGALVAPGDLAGQVAQVLRNTRTALSSVGAGFGDVVRMTFYVAGWTPDQVDAFMSGVHAVAEEVGLPLPMPPASLIGVEVLFEPGVLVELEVDAVLP
ncbi:Rid family hydrolase [Quadrisphaera sp. KR29]|uniref:Rid family hydrolase n=1 Tax=Quadrisphaera sp. KR29 TaxID=3461391 RepID=UPI0040444DCD